MLEVVLGELALLAILAALFVALHGRRGWWRLADGQPNWVGRQLMALALVVLALAVSLFLLGADWDPPLVVFAVVIGATDLMMAGWLALLWHARRDNGQEQGS